MMVMVTVTALALQPVATQHLRGHDREKSAVGETMPAVCSRAKPAVEVLLGELQAAFNHWSHRSLECFVLCVCVCVHVCACVCACVR